MFAKRTWKTDKDAIVSIAIWSMAIWFLVNVAWSAWFAWGFNHAGCVDLVWPRVLPVGESTLEHGGTLWIMKDTDRLVTQYTIRMHNRYTPVRPDSVYYDILSTSHFGSPPNEPNDNPWTYEDLAPFWLSSLKGNPASAILDVQHGNWEVASVGWPLRLLWCAASSPDSHHLFDPGYTYHTAVEISGPVGMGGGLGRFGRAMPIRPIWTGQLFVVVMSVLVVLLLKNALRRQRARRGRCPRCAYRLVGNVSQTCSECGNDVAGWQSRVRPRLIRFCVSRKYDLSSEQTWRVRYRVLTSVEMMIWIAGLVGTLALVFVWNHLSVSQSTSDLALKRLVIIYGMPIAFLTLPFISALPFLLKVHRRIRDALRIEGVPICVQCEYDLRTASTHCPECGMPIDEMPVVTDAGSSPG